MSLFDLVYLTALSIVLFVITNASTHEHHKDIQAAISDHPCATPALIELKPDLTNAKAYNLNSFKG